MRLRGSGWRRDWNERRFRFHSSLGVLGLKTGMYISLKSKSLHDEK